MKKRALLALPIITTIFSWMTLTDSVKANTYYFYVTNKTDSTIKELLVSEDQKNWGYFDIGSGIRPGERNVRIDWDQSTNNEDCNQWLKAVYADKSQSTPAKFNFCQNMNDPIVFE